MEDNLKILKVEYLSNQEIIGKLKGNLECGSAQPIFSPFFFSFFFLFL